MTTQTLATIRLDAETRAVQHIPRFDATTEEVWTAPLTGSTVPPADWTVRSEQLLPDYQDAAAR
jgi:hypothetical protein